ncbi:hypothetical protein FBY34_2046 [Streptomyces sp. SLBN-115]|nr:hypothetical protein FBY34_2046 [Streptomyces sp. SLBN-115]
MVSVSCQVMSSKRSTSRAAPSLSSVTDVRDSSGTAPVRECPAARASGPAIQKPSGRLRSPVRASLYAASATAWPGEPVGKASTGPRRPLLTSSKRRSVTATTSPAVSARRRDESPRTRYSSALAPTRTATTVLVGLARWVRSQLSSWRDRMVVIVSARQSASGRAGCAVMVLSSSPPSVAENQATPCLHPVSAPATPAPSRSTAASGAAAAKSSFSRPGSAGSEARVTLTPATPRRAGRGE